MKYDIFISYKSESRQVVDALVHALESNQIRCWYAPRNLDRNAAGKDYDDEIIEAIKESYAVVVILTDAALQSKWVKREVSQAEKNGKFILPYVISELMVDNGLRMRLEDKHWIDAYPEPEKKFAQLIDNVKLLLGRETSASSVNAVVAGPEKPSVQTFNFDYDFEEGEAMMTTDAYIDAIVPFLNSAEKGRHEAQNRLYDIFLLHSRELSRQLPDDVWERIESLADDGKAFATLLMHFKYYGLGNQPDIAMKYLRRAIDLEPIPAAFHQLGICHAWGIGIPQNHILGLHYFRKAADAGCIASYSYIGQQYQFGGNRLEADATKAEEFFLKGIEAGDHRSYEKLVAFYKYAGQQEKAIETAQMIIDRGIPGAYCAMGDAVTTDEEPNSGKQWYLEALDHNEKEAYGSLARIYWSIDKKDLAMRMASRGKMEGDPYSIFLLAYFSQLNGDYPAAWQNYRQRYLQSGIGADMLAHLMLEYNYTPVDFNVNELKSWLKIESQNHNLESVRMLLRLIVHESTGKDTLSYNDLKSLPESYPFIKIGAELRDPELMYMYGRLMQQDGSPYLNPLKAQTMFEQGAELGNDDCLEEVLTSCQQPDADADRTARWADFAMDNDKYPSRHDYLLGKDNFRVVIEHNTKSEHQRAEYAVRYLKHIFEYYPGLHCALFNTIVRFIEQGIISVGDDSGSDTATVISQELYGKIREQSVQLLGREESLEEFAPGFLRMLRPSLGHIFGYDRTDVAMADNPTLNALKLLYTDCTDISGDYLPNALFIDELSKPFKDDISYRAIADEDRQNMVVEPRYLQDAYIRFAEAYAAICAAHPEIKAVALPDLHLDDLYPIARPTRLLQVGFDMFRALMSLRPLFDPDTYIRIFSKLGYDYNAVVDMASDTSSGISAELSKIIICYVEPTLYIGETFASVERLQCACLDNDRVAIAQYLNRIIERIHEDGISTNLTRFSPTSIPYFDNNFDSDDDEDDEDEDDNTEE